MCLVAPLVFACWLWAALVPAAYGMAVDPDPRALIADLDRGGVREGNGFARLTALLQGPATIVATVALSDDWKPVPGEEIWLAALSPHAGGPAAGLVWTEVQAGWIKVWRIQARSAAGGAGGGGAPGPAGSAGVAGAAGGVPVAPRLGPVTAAPQPGHTYTTVLSVDLASGWGSFLVYDETTEERLFVGEFQVTAPGGEGYAAAGALGERQGQAPGGVRVEALAAYGAYLPVAARLELVYASNPSLPLRVFERTEPIAMRLVTAGSVPDGAFWIRSRHYDTGDTGELGPLQPGADAAARPFTLVDRPGRTSIALEYVRDGHRWFADAFDVSLGWMSVDFANIRLSDDGTAVEGEVRFLSDGPLTEVPVAIAVERRVVWREAAAGEHGSGVYRDAAYPSVPIFSGRVDVDGEVRRSLTVPLDPERPGVWEIAFTVSSPSSVELRRYHTQGHVVATVGGRAWRPGAERRERPEPAPAISLEEEARLRAEAAWRPRRIIFNNDGGDARAPGSARTMESFLASRTSPLVGSQVDTIVYETTAGTFSSFSHWTEEGEIFLLREDVYAHNFTPELILRHGTDPLQAVIDFSRANGFEIFWSFRMNDTHDASNPLLLPEFKRAHPELLFGTPENRPPHGANGAWSGVDYADPLVREMAFRFVEEVAATYDVDGILLDYFRHPVFFRRAAWGEAIGSEELEQMTELLRRIRTRLREIGAARGKPILLAVRVPDSLEYNRAIGIDLERWLAEGLFDILIPGGYFRLNRWEESVALGARYGVPVYPSLDESRVEGDGGARESLESYRARAMNVWHSGAAGIFLFNMHQPRHPMLREIGDPATLAGREKVYFVSVRGGARSANPRRFVGGSTDYFRIPILTPDSPALVRGDEPLALGIDVGDDLAADLAAGRPPVVTLRLITAGDQQAQEAAAEALSVRLNGRLLERPTLSAGALEYAVDPTWVLRGENRLELTIAAQPGGTGAGAPQVRLLDVQVRVAFPRR